jgi:hypothetical protein
MKKIILSIFLLNILFTLIPQENIIAERIYYFKIIAFHKIYDIYCTKNPMGYYKYPQKINDSTIYVTYETSDFYNQSKFDEKFTVADFFYPTTLWALSNGSVTKLKKRYGPVIDKNRKRKNYPYGFGKN